MGLSAMNKPMILLPTATSREFTTTIGPGHIKAALPRITTGVR